MFAAFNGIINGMLMNVHIISRPINWFGNKWLAMFVLGLASVWNNYGINMIFFLMALQSVPLELYECAEIDGIGSGIGYYQRTAGRRDGSGYDLCI